MIIFGNRSMFKNLEAGTFDCPKCRAERYYTLQRARRWFTLFFIPILPYRDFGKVVRCHRCNGLFGPQVLPFEPLPAAAGPGSAPQWWE